MKKLMCVLIAGAVLAVGTTAMAGDGPFFKKISAPGPRLFGQSAWFGQVAPPPAPAPAAEGEVPIAPRPVPEPAGELYPCVKYKDLHEMHPCAVPKIVAVLDPCAQHDPCSCCKPRCVYVKICVPPCGCEQVKVRRHGRRVRYDYGKYAVDIRVKRGYIEVDYQD